VKFIKISQILNILIFQEGLKMAKGSTMLKVVGILMIIFGAIGIIISITAFAGVALLDAAGANMGLAYVACVISLLGSVAELVTGIMGVINCEKPEKAQLLMTCAIVIIALSLLGNIIFPLIAGSGVSVVSFLIGLILPGLFIFGAIQNKQG
jgi:hypothetical protein